MKKIISFVVSVILLITVISVGAVAADRPVYLVLGDSIAYGSGLDNPREACYGRIVADTNGYDYVNHSVPGHTTSNLISRLNEDAVIADLKRADIISISIGGNNFLMSNLIGLMFDSMVMGDYTEFDAIAENFYNEFCEVMDIINAHNPDAVVLMQTLYNPQSEPLRAPYQQGADRINAAIERYNKEHPGEIVIVDVATALGDDMANYAGDDIHPSAKGNEEIAKAVLAKLYELKLGSNTQPIINTAGTDIEISPIFTTPMTVMGYSFNFIADLVSIIKVTVNFIVSLF
ncbi:MAG: hypothetical protein IJZ88_05815 [Clostridia bacterium]|nr:hypothetical protein [Clostridia bacterium]